MKKEITPWEQLNLAVKAHKAMMRCNEGESVRFCGADGIHVYSGLGLLAEAACQAVRTHGRKNDIFPFESEFEYKGVTFHQIGESAEESYGVK